MTVLDWRLDTVDASNHLVPAAGIKESAPSPTITLTTHEIIPGSIHLSDDGQHILVDISIAGTVDSAMSDNRIGVDGEIEEISVFLNGNSLPQKTLPLDVKRVESNSLLHPFDYTGEFDTLLEDVEVMAGTNTLKFVAQDKVFGYAGFATVDLPISVTEPYRLDVYFGPGADGNLFV